MTSTNPIGVEFGAVYELVGPDGTRAVLNNPGDPDFAGFLTGDDAVTGLERAAVRESADVIPEGDGGVHGTFRYDRLAFTLKGIVPPGGGVDELAEWARRQDRLLGATDAMRADGILRWTTSTGTAVQVAFRQQQATRITGRRPKSFLVAGVCERAAVESQAVATTTIPIDAVSSGGLASPMVSPLASTAALAGAATVTNIGSADAWPTFTIAGPITNPSIRSLRFGLELRFLYTLAAGETLVVVTDPSRRSILLNGSPTADRYDALDYLPSSWFPLAPGGNDLRIGAASYSAGASVAVSFRHAWG